MKASEFEELVSGVLEACHNGHQAVGPGFFGLYAFVGVGSIGQALTNDSGPLKALYPFIQKNQALSDEFTTAFFQDLEYPLSDETLLISKARYHHSEAEALFVKFYESLLEKQKIHKQSHADKLKSKIDELIDGTLASIAEAKRLLDAKIETLATEITSLEKKKVVSEAATLFTPENIKVKKEKQNALRGIIDCLVSAENDTRSIKSKVAALRPSEYPSINTLRLAFKKPYTNAIQGINKIIRNNDSITKHLGIGEIVNYVVKFLTCCIKGYSTDTNGVVETSLRLVDKNVIKNGVAPANRYHSDYDNSGPLSDNYRRFGVKF